MQVLGLLREIVGTFTEMAPYLLLGLTFAGVLHVMFSGDQVARHLGGNSLSSVVKAAVLGVPLPLCSCGVVPTALSLRKNNASDGATVSFLISTPQTGVDSIFATYGMLGPVFAIFRPVAAFVMGIAGGVVTNLLGPGGKDRNDAPGSPGCRLCSETDVHSHSLRDNILGAIKYGYGDFLDDIAKHLVVGIVLSGVISFFLPDDFFAKYVGNTLLEMLIMIVGGIPLYVCATASVPIAAALMMKGVSPGAAFVFLAVGPATNAATITLVGNVMGRRTVAVYLGSIAALSMGAGWFLNLIADSVSVRIPMMDHHVHGMARPWFVKGLSAAFLVMLLLSLRRNYLPGRAGKSVSFERAITIGIGGMTCGKCAHRVEEEILHVEGVDDVVVDLKGKLARVVGEFDIKSVKSTVRGAGYQVLEKDSENP